MYTYIVKEKAYDHYTHLPFLNILNSTNANTTALFINTTQTGTTKAQ